MSKAENIHHTNRLKNRRKRDFCYFSKLTNRAFGNINQHVTTPKMCSCYMCGNPRKFYGNSHHAKTQQEIKAELSAKIID